MRKEKKKAAFGVNTVDPIADIPEQYDIELFRQCLDRIRKWGYFYVEYSHVHHLNEDAAKQIGDYTKSLGLIPYSVHMEGNIPKYGAKRYFEIQRDCLRNARLLGCEIAVFHLPYPEGVPTKGENIKPLKKVVGMAEETGVVLALENGPIDLITEIVQELAHPSLKCTLDTGHAHRDGYDICTAIRKMGKNLIHLHLADNFGKTDDHLPPGVGLIEWRSAWKALKEVTYSGVFMVELTGPGIKAHRHITGLRDFCLEKEMEIAYATLQYLEDYIKAVE